MNAAPTHFVDAPGLLLFAFDGTNNKDYGKDNSPSNVVKFRDSYLKDPKEPPMFKDNENITTFAKQKVAYGNFIRQNAFYISGAGTEDKYSGITAPVGDGGVGLTIIDRVNKMIDYLEVYLSNARKNRTNKTTNIKLDIVGFSRGAASARMFASKVAEIMSTGVWYNYETFGGYKTSTRITRRWENTTKALRDCGINFNFNFLGLWDTVPAFGTNTDNDVTDLNSIGMSLSINPLYKKVVHAVAVNENRENFHGRSIFDNPDQAQRYANNETRIERGFLGAHSDIGGGYKEGDLSDVALIFMIQEASEAGLKFVVPNEYFNITNPIVHDSIGVRQSVVNFMPGREFRWVGKDVKLHEGQLQMSSFPHLRLNWQDTKQFQPLVGTNRRRNKFEAIQEQTLKYIDNDIKGNHKFCGQTIICPETEEIIKLKKNDKEGNPSILYSKSHFGEEIQIQNYIKWLQNNGYGLKNLKVNGKLVTP